MEDIDAAFISSINRGVSDENEDDSASNDSQPQKQTKHVSKYVHLFDLSWRFV
jgi:hypothetical protein